jgi:hypothetical protein
VSISRARIAVKLLKHLRIHAEIVEAVDVTAPREGPGIASQLVAAVEEQRHPVPVVCGSQGQRLREEALHDVTKILVGVTVNLIALSVYLSKIRQRLRYLFCRSHLSSFPKTSATAF